MRVTVIGASGDQGAAQVAALVHAGHRPIAVSRNPAPLAIDGIAVTNAPGLIGALLVGLSTAKALAWVTGKPIIGVHHLEGHLSAIYLEPNPPPLPHLALIVSGGHTSLVRVNGHGDIIELGATLGLQVVAEGVEGSGQLAQLQSLGCPLGQGYWFARPMPAADAGEHLAASGSRLA